MEVINGVDGVSIKKDEVDGKMKIVIDKTKLEASDDSIRNCEALPSIGSSASYKGSCPTAQVQIHIKDQHQTSMKYLFNFVFSYDDFRRE